MAYLLLVLFFSSLPVEAAGNGSSGIGNPLVPVVDDIVVPLDQSKYRKDGDTILRYSDNHNVLSIQLLSHPEFEQTRKRFNPALLGGVRGWEYLPDRDLEPNASNSWIVCGSSKQCVLLRAEATAGFDAAALLGSIRKKEE